MVTMIRIGFYPVDRKHAALDQEKRCFDSVCSDKIRLVRKIVMMDVDPAE